MISYTCSETKATEIANRLFKKYDLNGTGVLDKHKGLNMLKDVFSNNNSYTPTMQDADNFVTTHDIDKDGKFTVKDLENLAKKYFCTKITVNHKYVTSNKEDAIKNKLNQKTLQNNADIKYVKTEENSCDNGDWRQDSNIFDD